jgi:ABC-type spermidine/putrescine transport system permease subunit I
VPSNIESGEPGAVGQHDRFWQAFAAPGLLWLIVLFVTPFYAILAVAMGSLDPILLIAEPIWNPLDWNVSVFREVGGELFTGQLGLIALRTIAYVFVATTLCVAIGYPVAYFVARRAGKRKFVYLLLILAPFWINYLMRMLAWVNLLSPDGQVNRFLENFGVGPVDWLSGHHFVVIMGLVYGYIPFFILPLYASLDRIDKQTLEAARDLGAGRAHAFRRVTLPLSRQGILAGLVIIMLPMFGDYYTNQLLSGSPRTRMFGNQIEQFVNSTVGGSAGAAYTIVLMAFVAVLMFYYLLSVAKATRVARDEE